MIECRKKLACVALLGCLLLLVAGCDEGGSGNEDTIDLSAAACHPEDVSFTPPFITAITRTAVPEDTFLVDQIVNYYGVELIEPALTNAAVFCDLFEMTDEASAVEMLNRTCTVAMDEVDPPVVGEEVCARVSGGFRLVNFRQGRVVVSIFADSNGGGVDTWAAAVNGRLLQK